MANTIEQVLERRFVTQRIELRLDVCQCQPAASLAVRLVKPPERAVCFAQSERRGGKPVRGNITVAVPLQNACQSLSGGSMVPCERMCLRQLHGDGQVMGSCPASA